MHSRAMGRSLMEGMVLQGGTATTPLRRTGEVALLRVEPRSPGLGVIRCTRRSLACPCRRTAQMRATASWTISMAWAKLLGRKYLPLVVQRASQLLDRRQAVLRAPISTAWGGVQDTR